jgi:TPR repeat protein
MVASAQENGLTESSIDLPAVTSPTPAQSNPDVLLAEQGDAFAQYRLGRFYAQQSGVHSPEAVSWYMKASDGLRQLASTGNGKAMYVLGVMYAFGRGVVQNREEARSWLAQALAHQVPAAGPVLASLDKYRPADPNPPITVQAKRRQT